MENIALWIIVAVLGVAIIGFIVYKIISIAKMSPEERKKTLVTYLIGLVTLAEEEMGRRNLNKLKNGLMKKRRLL